jgi:hypothetical protein
MSNRCFFETFAQFIQPDFNRTESEGDFYNSPLKHLGVKNAYQVSPDMMRYSYNHEKIYINLHEICYFRDKSKEGLKLEFKNKEQAIIFSEALMQIYKKPELKKIRPEDFNFFKGVLAYFGSNKDTASEHTANEKLYRCLLDASLAVVLFTYQHYQLDIPKQSHLTAGKFSLWSEQNQAIDTTELLTCYKNYYQRSMEKYADVWKNFIFYKKSSYLNGYGAGLIKVMLFETRRVKNTIDDIPSFCGTHFNIRFHDEPFNRLFHIARNAKDASFYQAGEHFSFYEKHPSPLFLWDMLLLLDLIQYLEENQQDIIMTTDLIDNGNTGSSGLSTNDLNAEPTSALVLRNKIRNPLASQDSRFYNPNAVISTEQNSTIQLPIFLYNGDDLEIESLEADDMEIPQRIKLRLEETLLDTVCGEFWLLKFGVFVYHGDTRTHIPSDMINEEIIDINGVSYVEFTIELDWMITKMVGLKLGRGIPSPLAGFTGEKGEGLIAIVFDMN